MKWCNFHGGAVALLDQETEALFTQCEAALRAEFPPDRRTVIVLLPWRASPENVMRNDGLVRSFLCSRPVLDDLLTLCPDTPLEHLCFSLLKAILNGQVSIERMLIRQLPLEASETNSEPQAAPAALLMAHRGSAEHLQMALTFLHAGNGNHLRVRVGLDLEELDAYRPLAGGHKEIEFYQVQPSVAGPYVIRQKLAELSSEPLLVFHDSDDISCSDRFECLRNELSSTHSDLAGCHELRVDEIAGEARAYRFPLDVSRALDAGPNHALLHSTSMIRREAFFAAGGFSTNQIISSDTQFLFRAYFHLRIRNADRFLYVRRRHPGALTVRPATALGSPMRWQIEQHWGSDFEAVKRGQLELSNSTLRPERSSVEHDLVPLV